MEWRDPQSKMILSNQSALDVGVIYQPEGFETTFETSDDSILHFVQGKGRAIPVTGRSWTFRWQRDANNHNRTLVSKFLNRVSFAENAGPLNALQHAFQNLESNFG